MGWVVGEIGAGVGVVLEGCLVAAGTAGAFEGMSAAATFALPATVVPESVGTGALNAFDWAGIAVSLPSATTVVAVELTLLRGASSAALFPTSFPRACAGATISAAGALAETGGAFGLGSAAGGDGAVGSWGAGVFDGSAGDGRWEAWGADAGGGRRMAALGLKAVFLFNMVVVQCPAAHAVCSQGKRVYSRIRRELWGKKLEYQNNPY